MTDVTVDHDQVDDFLAHYGVLGMKWGVRKREDKPVSAETRAKREARAKKYDARADMFSTKIRDIEGLKNRNRYQQKYDKERIGDLTKERDRAKSDAQAKREGRLSRGQKQAVIGASVAAGILAAAAIHYGVESGHFRQMAERGKAFLNGQDGIAFKRNEALADKNLDIDAVHNLVSKKINPDFGEIGTKMNCRRATFAYEMRRRGYDVMATRTTNANGQNAAGLLNATRKGKSISTSTPAVVTRSMKEVFDKQNGKATPLTDVMKAFPAGGRTAVEDANAKGLGGVLRALAKEPSGSRGEVGVMWDMGGGHSMSYEIFNGKPVIFDNQTGQRFVELASGAISADGKTPLENAPRLAKAAYTRLDNVELNDDFLSRWVKNAK